MHRDLRVVEKKAVVRSLQQNPKNYWKIFPSSRGDALLDTIFLLTGFPFSDLIFTSFLEYKFNYGYLLTISSYTFRLLLSFFISILTFVSTLFVLLLLYIICIKWIWYSKFPNDMTVQVSYYFAQQAHFFLLQFVIRYPTSVKNITSNFYLIFSIVDVTALKSCTEAWFAS